MAAILFTKRSGVKERRNSSARPPHWLGLASRPDFQFLLIGLGLGGFNHVIAGSTKQFHLVVTGVESWGAYFMQFFAPTLLGNIIGGVSLVVFLGHAQVVAGKDNVAQSK